MTEYLIRVYVHADTLAEATAFAEATVFPEEPVYCDVIESD